MIKQSLQKIDKLIRERQYSLPEIMLKVEAFLMHFSKKIVSQGEDYTASDLYAEAVKFFRNYLLQQPYKLTKITTPAIAQAIQSDSLEHLEQLFALRNRFLKELAAFTPSDPFGKKIVSELNDLKWVKKLVKQLVPAQQLRRISQLKKKTKTFFSELTVLLWYGELKGEYLVHIDTFLERCVTFFKEYFTVAQFIDNNSFAYLQQLCDPENKYYLTIHQCDDFFQRLRSPQVINKLWQLTQQKKKFLNFQSQSSIVMHLTNKEQSVDQIIGVTGQKLIMAQGVERDVKLPPVVLVGSAADCDLVLKSKYISRKQMLIIEEKKSIKHQQYERYNYYIVCLSSTNFTLLQFPYRVKASVGVIFYAESTKYQIVGCQKEEMLGQTQEEQDQRTLSLLPSQSSIKASENNYKLTLLILSGEDKEKQFSLRASTFKKLTEGDYKHEIVLKDHLQHDEGFYIRPNVKILAKSSNDILQGRTSRKLRLCKGMRVILDEYVLSID